MSSLLKILSVSSSVVERLVEAQRVGGSIPSFRTNSLGSKMGMLWSAKPARGEFDSPPGVQFRGRLHTGGCRRFPHGSGEYVFGSNPVFRSFPSRPMAGHLTVNQRIVVRIHAREPIPESSKGRTSASEAANTRSSRVSGSIFNPASSKGRTADFEFVNLRSSRRAGTIPVGRQQ